MPNYKDDLTNEDLEYIQELLQKHSKNFVHNEFSEVDKKSVKNETEEPETFVEESLVEMNSTTKLVKKDEETNKIPKLTSEENSTENVVQDSKDDHV